jgi:hypothetical protein
MIIKRKRIKIINNTDNGDNKKETTIATIG